MKIDYTRYYRKWHNDSDSHRESIIAHTINLLSDHLPNDRSGAVLDVGCGMGFAILALRKLGFGTLKGVECDRGQAQSCWDKGLDVTLTDDTLDYLRGQAAQFDLIIALDVLEHIPVAAQMDFIEAIGAALRPGGRFICTVPNANSALASRWRYNDWTHSCSFTEHSLDFLMFHGGFDEIRISPCEFVRRPKTVWLPVSGARHWWVFKFFRLLRRLEMMAELGPAQGRTVPLSLNILGVGIKAGGNPATLPSGSRSA